MKVSQIASIVNNHKHDDIGVLCKAISDKYYAKRKNLKLYELKKNIQKGNPCVISLNKANYTIVGENPDSVIIYTEDGATEIEDNKILQQWDGETVIIEGEKEIEPLVIFTPEQDNWRDILARNKTIDIVKNITIGEAWLPECPVILTFKEPGEKEQREKIRAQLQGVTITLFDTEDPLLEFFHEVGHIYWRDELTEAEKRHFDNMVTFADPKNPLLSSRWAVTNGEELFCTLYVWYAKGQLISSGYERILQYHAPEWYEALQTIFDRVAETRMQKKRWKEEEKKIAEYLDKAIKYVYVNKNGTMIKARIACTEQLNNVYFPTFVPHSVVYSGKKIDYVIVKSGRLKGKMLAIDKKTRQIIFTKTSNTRIRSRNNTLAKAKNSTKRKESIFSKIKKIVKGGKNERL